MSFLSLIVKNATKQDSISPFRVIFSVRMGIESSSFVSVDEF